MLREHGLRRWAAAADRPGGRDVNQAVGSDFSRDMKPSWS